MVRRNRYHIVRDNFLNDPTKNAKDIALDYKNRILKLPTDYYCYIYLDLEKIPSDVPFGVEELISNDCAFYVGKGRGKKCTDHIQEAKSSRKTAIGKSKLKNKKTGDWSALKDGNDYLNNISYSDEIRLGLTILHSNIHQGMLTKRQHPKKFDHGCSAEEVIMYSVLIRKSDPAAQVIVEKEKDAKIINELLKHSTSANRDVVPRKCSQTHFTILNVNRPKYLLFQKVRYTKETREERYTDQHITKFFAVPKKTEEEVKKPSPKDPKLLLSNGGNMSVCNAFVQCMRASTITTELTLDKYLRKPLVQELRRLCFHTGSEHLEASWRTLLPPDWYKNDSNENDIVAFAEHIVGFFPKELRKEFITEKRICHRCPSKVSFHKSFDQIILQLHSDTVPDDANAIKLQLFVEQTYRPVKIDKECPCQPSCGKLKQCTIFEVPSSCNTLLIALPGKVNISKLDEVITLGGVDWVLTAAIQNEELVSLKKRNPLNPKYTAFVKEFDGPRFHIADNGVIAKNAKYPRCMRGIQLIWLDRKIIED